MSELVGQLALVTGGARGLGAAISAELGRRGATVVVADVDAEAAALQAERLREQGVVAHSIDVDVSRAESVELSAAAVVERFGDLSVLVNNAGVAGTGKIGDPDSWKLWSRVVDVNLHGVYRVTAAFLESLKRTRGCIVNVGSVVGLRSGSTNPAYAASKGAVTALTRTLARDLAEYGVRVNAVAPGYFDTEMGVKGTPQGQTWVDWHCPMKRFGEPEEIGGPVAFLASTEASFITGVTLPVDGGYLTV